MICREHTIRLWSALAVVVLLCGIGPADAAWFDFRVPGSNSDAEEDAPVSDGSMDLTSSDLELVFDGGGEQVVGIRFNNINLVQDSSFTQAYIQFTVDEADSGTTNVVIAGEDADNAAVFTTGTNNITNRTPTTATTNWNNIPAWTSSDIGTYKTSADVVGIVNEIFARLGWSSNNALSFQISAGTGCTTIACQRTAESWNGSQSTEGNTSLAPSLHMFASGYRFPPADAMCYAAPDDQNRLEMLALSDNQSCPDGTPTTIDRGETCVIGSMELRNTSRNPETIEMDAVNGNLWGFDYAAGTGSGSNAYFGRVSPVTGQFFALPNPVGTGSGCRGNGAAANNLNFNDLDGVAFDPVTNQAFATDTASSSSNNGAAGERYLIRLNTTTGALVPNAFPAGTCTNHGGDNLVDFLPVTGLRDDTGALLNQADDLAIDPVLTSGGVPVMYVSTAARLHTINRTTGASTSVGVFQFSGSSVVDVEGMSIDENGQLYGATGTTGGLGVANRFWELEKADGDGDGFVVATRIDNGGVDVVPQGTDYEGIACFFISSITRATIAGMRGFVGDSGHGVIEWHTESEIGSAGFILKRWDEEKGRFRRVNKRPVPASLSPAGGVYRVEDPDVYAGGTYHYRLVEIEGSGKRNRYGPFVVTIDAYAPDAVTGEISGGPARSTAVSDDIRLPLSNRMEGAHFSVDPFAPGSRTVARIKDRKRDKAKKRKRRSKAPAKKRANRKKSPGARMITGMDTLYTVSATELADALELPLNKVRKRLARGRINITQGGKPVAYLPAAGGDGAFFLGEAIDSIYTDKNVYQVEKARGMTMKYLHGAGPNPVPGGTFRSHVDFEEDLVAGIVVTRDDPESDLWFWDYVMGGDPATSFVVPLVGAADSGVATLKLRLWGFDDLSLGDDQHVVVHVNGHHVGEMTWDSDKLEVFEATFEQNYLVDGDNTIEVQALLDPGVDLSVVYVDGMSLEYERYLHTSDDMLQVTTGDNSAVTVSGFSNRRIGVFDITEPRKPSVVLATTIDHDGTGWRVSFTPAAPHNRYLVLTENAVALPEAVHKNNPSRLKRRRNKGEYLVIVPDEEELLHAAQELVDYRAADYSTKMVNLQDVYNEFSDGIVNPHAIKDFLKYAYENWRRPPKTAAFIGKGNYDHKNNLGLHTNLFPVLMVSARGALFASDAPFGDLTDGDGYPEIAVGRIPILTAEELERYIQKIKTYESTPAFFQAHLIADDDDNFNAFHRGSDGVAGFFPDFHIVNKIYHDSGATADTTRQAIINAINAGTDTLNYIGHAGVMQFADEGLLRDLDVSELNNATQLPILLAMTCIIGNGAFPGLDSLVELLLTHDNGGIAAAFGPSGLSDNEQAVRLNKYMVEALYGDDAASTIGDAAVRALIKLADSGADRSMLDIYFVLGDPGLKVKH